MADQGAQPTQGAPEGAQAGQGNQMHEQFISSAPENLRDAARELAPLWDKSVQGKFQEAADFRKTWEPFAGIEGLSEYQPETLSELVDWDRMVRDDPEQFWQWYDEIGEFRPQGEDPEGSQGAEASDNSEVNELKQQLQEMTQWRQQIEQQQQQQQDEQLLAKGQEIVRNTLDEIKKSEFPQMTEEDERAIFQFATAYPDSPDAIQKGFEDYKKLISRFETGMFQQKSQDPAPAESGGSPNTAAEPVTSYEDARRVALERIRQSQ